MIQKSCGTGRCLDIHEHGRQIARVYRLACGQDNFFLWVRNGLWVLPMASECLPNGQNGETSAAVVRRASCLPHRAQLLQRLDNHRRIAADSFPVCSNSSHNKASEAAAWPFRAPCPRLPALLGEETAPTNGQPGSEVWAPGAHPIGFNSRFTLLSLELLFLYFNRNWYVWSIK